MHHKFLDIKLREELSHYNKNYNYVHLSITAPNTTAISTTKNKWEKKSREGD
jgi:ferritin